MTLFTGTTIFLTQLQLHLQDLLRIGPQDLEVFVKPNKQILQVEATLFNDHAGVLAVTLVRIWQAGKFHPFQNFPCDDLDVLGSPACTAKHVTIHTKSPTTGKPSATPISASPSEGPTQAPVKHIIKTESPSRTPTEGPTQVPVKGPAPKPNIKINVQLHVKPTARPSEASLEKKLKELKSSLFKELDIKLNALDAKSGSALLKAELMHYINQKVNLVNVESHASIEQLRAKLVESLKVMLERAIEGFHSGLHSKSITTAAPDAAALQKDYFGTKPTLTPKVTATSLPTTIPVEQKYHAEDDGFKSNIDAMMRLRDRAVHYRGMPKPVTGTGQGKLDHKQMYRPQFGKPMSTPRHCSPYDHWSVDTFC